MTAEHDCHRAHTRRRRGQSIRRHANCWGSASRLPLSSSAPPRRVGARFPHGSSETNHQAIDNKGINNEPCRIRDFGIVAACEPR